MSGYESPRPEDEVTLDEVPSEFDADDLAGDERPVDEAAAKAHDIQPDDEKPVLLPDDDPESEDEA
jgi:hypothetical protein